MFQLPKTVAKTVLRTATSLIDLGTTLKCIPYKRVNPNDFTSIELELNCRGSFLFVTTLLCAHAVAQWVSLFNYVPSHGLNAQACIHVNFLCLYTALPIFSLQQILRPETFLDAQNQIQRVEKSFKKSWTTHPILFLVLLALQGFLFVSPFLTIGVYLFDPKAPMFVLTTLLNVENNVMRVAGGYEAFKFITAALLESVIVFLSLLTTLSVSQTCIMIVVALNTWMADLRTRTREANIRVNSDWMLLEKLYRNIQMFSILSNCFYGSIIMPGGIVLVVIASAASLFCTLRLHGHLHPVVYAFFPGLAAYMIGGSLIGIYGEFSKVNRNACDCLDQLVKEGKKLRAFWVWNIGDEDIKFLRKKLRAMRSFGVEIGMFGFVTASTQIAIWDEIVNYLFLLLSL